MSSVLKRADIWAGLLVALLGAAALHLGADYPLGRAARVGPGYMPRMLGFALIGIGVLMLLRGLIADRGSVETGLPVRPLLLVPGAIIAFALLFETLGLVPAVLGAVGIAAFAAPDNGWRAALAIGAGLSVFSWALFTVGLGLPLPAFRW
jgi:hypothetical protein